jgi:hypothetical protein
MTEAEWMACTDPQKMLEVLKGKAGDRKLRLFACSWLRLFACSCFGHARDSILDERNQRAIELAERLAEGRAMNRNEIEVVRASARNGTAWCTILDSAWNAALHAARSGAGDAARCAIRSKTWRGEEWWDAAWSHARDQARKTQAALLHDLFGTLPFRPTTLPSSVRTWNGGLIERLAEATYEHRLLPSGQLDQERLAVLADAMEEAGADAEMVEHLRQLGPHVRGCFVVDLLTGRE